MKLIEQSAPNPDAAEFHEISIRAPSDVVYRTLWTANLGGSWIVRGLLALRSLPGVLRGRARHAAAPRLTLRGITTAGFGLLAEEPGREVLLGVTGRFWRPSGNVEPFDAASFARPVPPGLARGWWSFAVEAAGERTTILSTETRVACGDAASRRKFLLYWSVIRPFSGLIRILLLRAVRDAAEAQATAPGTSHP